MSAGATGAGGTGAGATGAGATGAGATGAGATGAAALPAECLAAAALALARAFAAGATLWCAAPGWPSHGRHVAVEFVHPVVVGARALPAVHLEQHPAEALRLLARPGDALLVIGAAGDPVATDLLRLGATWASERMWIGAGERPDSGAADHVVWLEGADPELAARSGDIVLCYHLLWELTQIVFEHPGLLRGGSAGDSGTARDLAADGEMCITCSDAASVVEVRRVLAGSIAEVAAGGRIEQVDTSLVEPVHEGDLLLCHAGAALSMLAPGMLDPGMPAPGVLHPGAPHTGAPGAPPAGAAPEATAFLYPFIEADEDDPLPLLEELASSARAKEAASRELRAAGIAGDGTVLRAAARQMAARFAAGGRLLAFGNGGSATDAESAVELFRRPPHGKALPALSLVEDRAVLTALANDVGFERVFSRQLIAYARPEDIALGFSTSGGSANVLAAFAEAARRGLLTVGLSGYGGGAMAASDDVAHCLAVASDSVHRVQEAEDALVVALWAEVQRLLAAPSASACPDPGAAGRPR